MKEVKDSWRGCRLAERLRQVSFAASENEDEKNDVKTTFKNIITETKRMVQWVLGGRQREIECILRVYPVLNLGQGGGEKRTVHQGKDKNLRTWSGGKSPRENGRVLTSSVSVLEKAQGTGEDREGKLKKKVSE